MSKTEIKLIEEYKYLRRTWIFENGSCYTLQFCIFKISFYSKYNVNLNFIIISIYPFVVWNLCFPVMLYRDEACGYNISTKCDQIYYRAMIFLSWSTKYTYFTDRYGMGFSFCIYYKEIYGMGFSFC